MSKIKGLLEGQEIKGHVEQGAQVRAQLNQESPIIGGILQDTTKILFKKDEVEGDIDD